VPTIDRGDVELYYEVRGAGPRLLLCNGSGATIEGSGALIAWLAGSFEVAVADQRGLGRTGLGRRDEPFTMAQYAADAAAVLDDLGWPRSRVLGISFGGMVALEYAVTWPQRVERLVLACTSPGGAGGASYPLHELARLDAPERERLTATLFDTRWDEAWLATHPRDATYVAEARRRASLERPANVAEGERRQLEARRHHDVLDRLGHITAPTLVAAGRFDGIAPLANSQVLASRIPDSELRVYEGGHAFLLQDPVAPVELGQFLARS
jgi:pimeloyl-ACP methyl ester carboxylesterase